MEQQLSDLILTNYIINDSIVSVVNDNFALSLDGIYVEEGRNMKHSEEQKESIGNRIY